MIPFNAFIGVIVIWEIFGKVLLIKTIVALVNADCAETDIISNFLISITYLKPKV